MQFRKSSFIFLSFFVTVLFAASTVESAPNNSTVTAPAVLPPKVNSTSPVVAKPAPVTGTLASNNTKSGNKTSEDSGEDCEPEAEPETSAGAKNVTTVSGQREGKQLSINDAKDKYKTHEGGAAEPEPEPVVEKIGSSTSSKNAAHKPGADAEKLQGGNSSSTTAAPSKGGAANKIPSSLLWANVIFTTLLASFTYSTL